MLNYEQLLRLSYPVHLLTFWRIFCPVPLFHHMRLLIFGESHPLCDYFMLLVYLIVKSISTNQNMKSCSAVVRILELRVLIEMDSSKITGVPSVINFSNIPGQNSLIFKITGACTRETRS